ncbi:MAG: hypothetical protein K6A23_02800 [Butyrivibrio sp.]|nr:hypothetical protein [Butyrivibrio sp.]
MRISKLLLKTAIFITIITVINSLLSFLLRPYLGSSAEMWTTYDTKSELDMIYTGSSQCIAALRPDVVDGKTGFTSYNMGTNMQSLHNSNKAIEQAIKDHGIKTVFAVIDFEMLSTDRYDNFRAEASFCQAQNKILPLSEAVMNNAEFITDKAFIGTPGSVNYFFPWVYDRNTNIGLNVREKLADSILDEEGHRDTYGFEASDEVLSQDIVSFSPEYARSIENDTSNKFTELYIDNEVIKELEKMVNLCRDNNVTLIAASVPYQNHLSVYNINDYQRVNNRLEEIFTGENTYYFDFNMIKPEYFVIEHDYYRDVGHLNTTGATAFSDFLGDFINSIDSEDVDEWFYDINDY